MSAGAPRRQPAQCSSSIHAGLVGTAPSVRLWERRPDHPDFLQLSAGLADLAWTPAVVDDRTTPVSFWVGSNDGASIVKLEPLE